MSDLDCCMCDLKGLILTSVSCPNWSSMGSFCPKRSGDTNVTIVTLERKLVFHMSTSSTMTISAKQLQQKYCSILRSTQGHWLSSSGGEGGRPPWYLGGEGGRASSSLLLLLSSSSSRLILLLIPSSFSSSCPCLIC